MSSYRPAIDEAIKALGLKKVLAEVYNSAKVVDEKTSGQIICHINQGGVSKVVQVAEIK